MREREPRVKCALAVTSERKEAEIGETPENRRVNVSTYVCERAARHAAAAVRFPSPPFLFTLAAVRKRNVTSADGAYADEDEDTDSHEDSRTRDNVGGDSFTSRFPRLSIRKDNTA